MAVQFVMPQMGENIESADVIGVLVKPGDIIARDEPVLEIETEKATVEVPSTVAGKVTQVSLKSGDKVKAGQVVLTVEDAEPSQAKVETTTPSQNQQESERPPEPPVGSGAPLASSQTIEQSPEPSELRKSPLPNPPPAGEGQNAAPVFASPAVRRFAREIGVEVRAIRGSGPGGRISEEDVKQFSRTQRTNPPGAPLPLASSQAPSAPAALAPLPDFSPFGPTQREPLNAVRRSSAKQVAINWSTIPHVTLHERADITALEQTRQQNRAAVESAGGKLTITAILLKVVAHALRAFPRVNSSIDAGRAELVLKNYYDIAVATDTERGLLVPVVRKVDQKNIRQLAIELPALAERARQGKLTPDDSAGATFTLTNLGSLGVESFSPIVNWPQVAILGVGRARQEPVFANNAFIPRLMLPLSLSFDHRAVDGADGARFLHWITQALENPLMMALEG